MRAPPFAALLAVVLLSGCGGASRSEGTTPHVAHIRGGTADPDPEGLGPTNAPTAAPHRRLPPLRACRIPHAADLDMLSLKVAGGAECAIARRIAVRVTRASWERCELHCAERSPIGFGYRCDAFSVGEADWTIDCRDGQRLVHVGLAD